METTCEARIRAQMLGRETMVRDLIAATGDDDDEEKRDRAFDELAELPLSVEIVHKVKVLLSTGGPADWLEATVQRHQHYGWELVGPVEYHFADWFDHAEETIDSDSPLYSYLEDYVLAGME